MSDRQVYLDHNATTPLHPEVVRSMSEAMAVFGNPSSLHGFGRVAKQYVDDARDTVASFIGADSDEMVFVGSGSEANNTVLSILACPGAQCGCDKQCPAEVITTVIEHPCVLESSRCLMERGIAVSFLDVDAQGKIDLGQLDSLMSDSAGVVSVMMANNEVGTLQDIKAIAKLVHERGALFHTDAVQAVGKIPIDVRDLDVDFLTMSAHKIYGPKGVGALYVKRGARFCPLIRGGHQERGRRAGTENTLGIIGLGKAVQLRGEEMAPEHDRLLRLKDILRTGIEDKIPDTCVNGHPTDCLTNTLNVSFQGAEGEAILLYLDFEGIAISTGSACASGSLDPSHVLLAMGLSAEYAHGSVRMSMGRATTEDDIDYVLDKLPGVIGKIRDMSTAYAGKSS